MSYTDENFCMPKKGKMPFMFRGRHEKEVVSLSKAGESRTL